MMHSDNSNAVREVEGCFPGAIPQDVLCSTVPVVLRGLVKTWPFVAAGLESHESACAYIKKYYTDKTVSTLIGPPEIRGHYFYNKDLSGFNYDNQRIRLDLVLEQIFAHINDELPPSFYVGSTTVDACLPGFRADNDVLIPNHQPQVSIWIGNRSRIAAHWDAAENIACCAVGKRRFTLFPPEQVANLYVGPLDLTPAGQAISLVDFAQPDFVKFPRFRQALDAAQVVELEAGDALFLPAMWWHHVEGLMPFNVLVNYWWRAAPKFMGQGISVLKHAMLSIRDLPTHEKLAWKHLFDYYIFGDQAVPVEYIPSNAQGVLAPVDDISARQLRSWLLNNLNR